MEYVTPTEVAFIAINLSKSQKLQPKAIFIHSLLCVCADRLNGSYISIYFSFSHNHNVRYSPWKNTDPM